MKLETVKTISTPRKINVISLDIEINRPKLVGTCNKLATFHGNLLNLSENSSRSFIGATFLTHTVDPPLLQQ